MPLPAISYHLPIDPHPLQGVSSADRPVCAMTTAYSLLMQGKELRGEYREIPYIQQVEGVEGWLRENEIPVARAKLWARGVDAERVPANIDPVFGPLTADPYQLDSVRHLTVAGGLLGMAPGLGKTLTACVAARHATLSHASRSRCWIVAPLNALGVWKRWEPELRKTFDDVKILSRDSLHKYANAENVGGVIIWDEIHGFRHMSATRTKNAHKLRSMFDVGIGLTGTVLHGGTEGVLSMLDLCVPGSALFASRWKAGEFFGCLVRKRIGSRTVTELEKPTGQNREKFMEYLHTYATMLSSTSATVKAAVEIPGQEITVVRIGEPWRPLHEEAADRALAIHAETGELPTAQKVAHDLCATGIDAKLEWLEETWDDHTMPVVLFANYTATLDAVAEWLNELGVSFVRVDGSVVGDDRAECVRRFQAGDVAVFLGQIGAAGIAVDLFRAHISVALDHSWKGDEYAQALARTARRGQTRQCYHFDLVANRLQERVVDRLQAAEDFNAEATAYGELRAAVQNPY